MSKMSTENSSSSKLFFFDLVKFTLLAFVIVAPIRYFVAQPFIVNGSSMDPTFANGDYLIVDRITYRFNEPERGQVIIFKYPYDTSKYFIKRVIGLPGEEVRIEGSKVTITNTANGEQTTINEPYLRFTARNFLSVKLQADEYFVMGDNRPASSCGLMTFLATGKPDTVN